jgi:hypothetical protein
MAHEHHGSEVLSLFARAVALDPPSRAAPARDPLSGGVDRGAARQ